MVRFSRAATRIKKSTVRPTKNVDFHIVHDIFPVHFDVYDEWRVSATERLAVYLFAVAY